MKYWSVAFHVDATGHEVYEAETLEEAMEIANDEFAASQDNTEIGDMIEIVDCNEITKEEFKRYSK